MTLELCHLLKSNKHRSQENGGGDTNFATAHTQASDILKQIHVTG